MDACLQKAREILLCGDSPLSLKMVLNVLNRVELFNLQGPRIIDQDLDAFKSLAFTPKRN
jgi:hypothetical protein